MKSLLPILLIVLHPSLLPAQKVKIHAYEQQVLSGVRKVTIDESGHGREIPNKIPARTFIYLEAPRDKKIEPKHVWINGKLYGVRVSTPTLPVIMQNFTVPSKAADTLVPKTSKQVLQLEPITDVDQFMPSKAAQRKMKSNKLVVHTIENGKNCYYYQNSIKMLDPVALQ